MKSILFYLLQVIICSGLLYGYYHLFLRNNKFHQYNRFYLLSTLLLSLAIPLLKIPLYFSNPQPGTALKTFMVIYGNGEEDVIVKNGFSFFTQLFTWQNAVIFFYVLIALVIFTRFAMAILKVNRLRKKYSAEKVDDFYFFNTTEPGTPFSFFNWLFWNRNIELESTEGHKIFRHEVFHIQQKHTLDILVTEFLTMLFWFNPFYHLVKKELKTIHEFLADRYAINKSDDSTYAELLLMHALNTKYKIVNPFFHNQIKRRIAMITSSKKTSYQYLRKVMVLPLAAIVTLLFAFKIYNTETNSIDTGNLDKPLTVVIDAGHGGTDKGAYALDGSFEKDYNIDIAKLVSELNTDPNLKIILTRNDDNAPGVKERSTFANQQNADLFLSLHCAAVDQKTAGNTNGMEVYISSKNKTHEAKNKIIASMLVSQFSKIHTTNKEIIKPQSGIWVLDNSNCPAALVECGFITDKTDLAFIQNKSNQQKIANAILTAIKNYGNNHNTMATINEEKITPLDTSIIKALIYIDGVEQKGMTSAQLGQKIKHADIDSIHVLKYEAAIKKYGEKGKDGVIEIVTKRPGTQKDMNVNDGIEQRNTAMQDVNKKYPKSDITSINVIKDESAIGISAKNGVGEITTKKNTGGTPLIVIDDVKQEGMTTAEMNKKVNHSDIKSINILKDQPAKDKYGDKGKNGVIEITTKRDILQNQ